MIDINELIEYDFIRVVLKNGTKIEGYTVCIDYYDETESGRNEIVIETEQNGIIAVRDDEIESWEIPANKFKCKRR